MATIEIRDVLDNETGKTIFPRTHVDAVIGLKDFSFFEKVQDTSDPTKFSIKLKSEFTGLWAEGWIASGGVGSGGGGGGYVLPIASANILGGIKVGSGLSIDSETGVLSVTGGGSYTLPTASANTLGGVKVGSGLSINQDGVLSATGGGSSFNGGEITNDLWLHTGSEDYGSTLYFGDKNGNTGYAYINEDSDDHLTIYARSGITLSTGDDAGVVINNLSVALGALSNVSLSSPTDGQSLVYRNGVWQNETVQGGGGGSGISSVSLDSGTNNGTLKLTVDGSVTDNIAVKGLGDLAYKSSLIASDIPDLSASKITSGTFDTARIPDLSSKYVTLDTTQNNISGAKTFTGGLAVDGSSYLDIGDARLVWDANNHALHITKRPGSSYTGDIGVYAEGFVASGATGQSS